MAPGVCLGRECNLKMVIPRVLELVAKLIGTWKVLKRKACSSQRALTFGIGEGRLFEGSPGIRVQASLPCVECLKEGL